MLISIIIPTLNEEKVLEQVLKSLRQLTALDYEIIISDGHSTDRTLEIAEKLADKVVSHDGKRRQTIGEGRNAGAYAAQGEYLVCLDADVFIPDINNFFLKAVNYFEHDSELVGMTVYIKPLPSEASFLDKVFFTLANWQIRFSNNVTHSGASAGEFQMIRASAFKKTGGYNPIFTIGEDNDMFVRLAKIGKTRTVKDLCVLHSSRRAHNIGWAKLLLLWWINAFYVKVLKKSYSKEWKVIR